MAHHTSTRLRATHGYVQSGNPHSSTPTVLLAVHTDAADVSLRLTPEQAREIAAVLLDHAARAEPLNHPMAAE